MLLRRVLAALGSAAVMLAGTGPVWGKDLVMGLSVQDYPPFYYQENGAYRGAAVEIARHVAGELGHTLSFERYPFARVQKLLAAGDIDGVILYFKTPEREAGAVYTNIPHIRETSSLFVHTDADISFDGELEEMQGKRIANVRGYSHGKPYDSADFLKKESVNTEKTLIRMIVAGRLDVGVGNKPAITFHAEHQGVVEDIRFLEPVIHNAPDYMAFSPARPDAEELAADFSRVIRAFKATAAYADILETYGFDPAVMRE